MKLFPSIHPSHHPSSPAEGILWLPILLLLQQPPIIPFLHFFQLSVFQVQQVQKLPLLHHLLLQSHHLWALGILLPLEILADLELRELQMHLLQEVRMQGPPLHPILLGWQLQGELLEHSHSSFWLQLLSSIFSNLLHKCNRTQYVHFYGHILDLDFSTSTWLLRGKCVHASNFCLATC